MVTCNCGDDFASKAKNRIIVQTPNLVADDAGGWVKTWADALTVWAIMEPMAGRELYLNAQLTSRVDQRITIRYQSSLADTTTAAKNRVKFGDRLFNVKFVKNLDDDIKTEGRRFQQLFCTEDEAA